MSEQVAELKRWIKRLEDRVFRLEEAGFQDRDADMTKRHALLQEIGAIERRRDIRPMTKELRDAAKRGA